MPPGVGSGSALSVPAPPPPVVAVVASARRAVVAPLRRSRSGVANPATFRGKWYADLRGLYRVFNPAVYRFYRSNTAPPAESDTPFDTNATLPHEPANVYADGVWYLSLSWFNGVLDSGFLPLTPDGKTYTRLELVGGVVAANPPAAPVDVRLELRANGVVRVIAYYAESGTLRADDWALTYTTTGVDPLTPPAVSPTVTVSMGGGVAVLAYDLPAQPDATVVKVRVQVRREDPPLSGTYIYSGESAVLAAVADAAGPSAVRSATQWPGRLPEDL